MTALLLGFDWLDRTTLLCLGSFLVGVVVGDVLDDAWHLFHESRKDRRMRKLRPPNVLEALVTLLLLAVVANIGLGAYLAVTRASDREIAVTACENANESRAAQRALWTYVLALSAASQEEPRTPEEQRRVDAFGAWMDELFAEHDCDDLGRVYEIPPPPALTG